MKLLRKFFRYGVVGGPAVSGRRLRAQPVLNVTVPAPLATPAKDAAAVFELPPTHTLGNRREPASFLKTARHRRLGAGL